MGRYLKTIDEANQAFNTNDLCIGKLLADGCQVEHRSRPFSIFTLKMSRNFNDTVMYEANDRTKNEFWSKLSSFDSKTLDLYFKALREYCW